MPLRSLTAPSRAKARAILDEWAIVDPKEINLDLIAADIGLGIVERSIEGAAARLVCNGSVGIVTVNQDIREIGRRRFAIAHEMGHFVLHRKRSPVATCTEKDFHDN